MLAGDRDAAVAAFERGAELGDAQAKKWLDKLAEEAGDENAKAALERLNDA